MQQNKILDIIINLLNGIKNKNSIVEEVEDETKMTLNGASYLLNQTLRQYNIPKSHYFISESAFELWNKISTDDILKYTYRDKITKNTNDNVCVDKYKGGEKEPFQKQIILKKGDSFIYNDVFTDEHIVTVSDIIKELLKLTTYTYSSITNILDKMYICKMLKSEDRIIKNKSKRSTDYRKVINNDYLSVGIKVKGFDYPQQPDKNNGIVAGNTIKNPSQKPTMITTQRKKVRHSRFGEGEVVSIQGDKIKVVFGGLQIKEFPYPQSIKDGTLTYLQSNTSPSCDLIIPKTCNPFFCFQGKQFFHEYNGGYIFAGADTNISHWNRLKAVKRGDIIFHCAAQEILAVGIAQGRYCLERRPTEHYLANGKPYTEGLIVKVKYQKLATPIQIFGYKKEIIRLQGDCEGRGYPFNKNGEGNQGYLFNLNRALTDFFISEILRRNPSSIQENLQKLLNENENKPNSSKKLCPNCNLNWIGDDEDCCLVCRRKVTIRGVGRRRKPINEDFIIINQRAFYRQRNGFQAYNSKGENVGIICMCFDKRTPAFECCELCFYEKYHNRYGEWNRIQSNGGRIKWSRLCELLENKDKIKIFVD